MILLVNLSNTLGQKFTVSLNGNLKIKFKVKIVSKNFRKWGQTLVYFTKIMCSMCNSDNFQKKKYFKPLLGSLNWKKFIFGWHHIKCSKSRQAWGILKIYCDKVSKNIKVNL